MIDIPAGSPFSLHNLPYGVFRRGGAAPRVGVAVGETILDLAVLTEAGLFAGTPAHGTDVFARASLNAFFALGRPAWAAVRRRIAALADGSDGALAAPVLRDRAVVPAREAELLLPVEVGDYTDFYSSREHATNVGIMFRGRENALLPNWLHLPVAYHGRSSSIVASGTPVRRPRGQMLPDGAERPVFGPTRQLDFELEFGAFVGAGNALGAPLSVTDAAGHVFGFVLVNDWSARDIQKWEYQPLGPFLAKNFATSVSPWVVPLAALEPFRVAGPAQDPEPLPYLRRAADWTFDVALEVALRTARMEAPVVIARSNTKYLYWDIAQQLAHHTVNGCNLRPGDLLASGTISGPDKSSRGSLIELTWRGTEPLQLPSGETRTFLEDGDELVIGARAEKDGIVVGFGEVRGTILPAEAS